MTVAADTPEVADIAEAAARPVDVKREYRMGSEVGPFRRRSGGDRHLAIEAAHRAAKRARKRLPGLAEADEDEIGAFGRHRAVGMHPPPPPPIGMVPSL